MRKIVLLLAFIIVIIGCRQFDDLNQITSINILDSAGKALNPISVESGQTITLTAQLVGANENEDISVLWRIPDNNEVNQPTGNNNALIVSSGSGTECDIRGLSEGITEIIVSAWRPGGEEQPRVRSIPIFVTQPRDAAGIAGINGPSRLAIGETQILTAALAPEWARGEITWSASPTGIVNLQKIEDSRSSAVEGLVEGQVTVTASTGSFTSSLTMQVTASAVQGNPVTGIRILFYNKEENLVGNTAAVNLIQLPVTNIIWLYPGDTVGLEAHTEGGDPVSINWSVDNASEVELSSSTGQTVTLKGGASTHFDLPPSIVTITAENESNITPASAYILVKTQPKPIWAWDRARDGHLNTTNIDNTDNRAIARAPFAGITEAGVSVRNIVISGSLAPTSTALTITGRGDDSRIKVRGGENRVSFFCGGNPIHYSRYGIKLNSSNNNSGNNPDPIVQPDNSTRIIIGSNNSYQSRYSNIANWNDWAGEFDFLKDPREIRISVDYEIIWSGAPSRDMWIMLNNNEANATRSPLANSSHLTIEPLTAARGTRATAIAIFDVQDLINRNPGHETLDRAFFTIIALSNGGSIYVSGIRVEYEN